MCTMVRNSGKRVVALATALLTTAMAWCRMLDSKWMYTAIVATDLEPPVATCNSPSQLDHWQKALDANEILILVPVMEILARYFNLVEPHESEATQVSYYRNSIISSYISSF